MLKKFYLYINLYINSFNVYNLKQVLWCSPFYFRHKRENSAIKNFNKFLKIIFEYLLYLSILSIYFILYLTFKTFKN
jgi:hypothetical protein